MGDHDLSGPLSWRDVYALVQDSEERAASRHTELVGKVDKIDTRLVTIEKAREVEIGVREARAQNIGGINRATLAIIISLIYPLVILAGAIGDMAVRLFHLG